MTGRSAPVKLNMTSAANSEASPEKAERNTVPGRALRRAYSSGNSPAVIMIAAVRFIGSPVNPYERPPKNMK